MAVGSKNEGPQRWPPLPDRWAAGLLLAIHAGMLAWSAFLHSPTQHEVAHLPAGLAAWRFGDVGLYRVNPPLVRGVAALPLFLAEHQEDWTGYRPGGPQRQEWRIGAQFMRANGERSWRLMTYARWACIPFSVLGGVICWRWGRELSGSWGGLAALMLWCTSPNILGHGALITPDAAAVATGLLSAYTFQLWRENRSIAAAFFAGIALGVALLTKTYWAVLLPLWPLLAGFDALRACRAAWRVGPVEENRRTAVWRCWALLGQTVLMLAVGLNVLNLGYGFLGTGTPLGELPFFSQVLAGETLDPVRDVPANRFSGTLLGALPIPVPWDWLTGIDVQRADFELGKWSYLLGETSETGWWYYYLLGLGVKVPLGTLLLAMWGVIAMCHTHDGRMRLGRLAPLWIPAGAIFLLASSQTGFSRHVRYVFSVLPVLYILAGQPLAAFCSEQVPALKGSALSERKATLVFIVLLGWAVLSSLWHYPHSLSYFNELAGGPAEGHWVLVDSNIDWGQDLSLVKEWIESHPEARPVSIAWLGFYDLQDAGVHAPLFDPAKLKPGWYIVSVHLLHEPRGRYGRFLRMEPVDRIGYSMNVYRLTAANQHEPRVDRR